MSGHGKARRGAAAVLGAIALLAVGSGCGGGEDATVADRPAPPASRFPAAAGRSLQEIVAQAPPERQLVVLPAGQVFHRGSNRFGFGVFTVDQDQVPDAEVALYVAPSGGGAAKGPFPARVEDLETSPAFRSQTVASDPDTATTVYVTSVPFAREGHWDVVALVRDGDQLRSARMPSVRVGGFGKIPAVGEQARRVHTPTASSVGGDLSRIDTRTPHDDMHEVDLHDALGKRPVVLLFATPALCQSRVCGPVVDEQLEAKAKFGDRVDFIHMEVYRNNNASDGLRPQMLAYGLPTEPWLFVIDRNGIVRTRIEGAFGVRELDEAIREVLDQ
jgi:hypothetical protein